MNVPDPERDPVLRDTIFVPGAVRLPRGSERAGTKEQLRPPQDPWVQAQAAAQAEGFRRGHEEGLRSGREEGLRAGYEDGLRRGEELAREQSAQAVERAVEAARGPLEDRSRQLDTLLRAMDAAAQEAWAAADDDVLVLCYETLCRVVGEAACSPESVRPQVQRALAENELAGDITLHLHPADVRLLDEAFAQGQLPEASQLKLRWRADPRVVLGGCMLVAAGGGIDARLETVLEQCKAGLLQARALRALDRGSAEAAT